MVSKSYAYPWPSLLDWSIGTMKPQTHHLDWDTTFLCRGFPEYIICMIHSLQNKGSTLMTKSTPCKQAKSCWLSLQGALCFPGYQSATQQQQSAYFSFPSKASALPVLYGMMPGSDSPTAQMLWRAKMLCWKAAEGRIFGSSPWCRRPTLALASRHGSREGSAHGRRKRCHHNLSGNVPSSQKQREFHRTSTTESMCSTPGPL